jgi:hypothetical protein
MVLKVFLINLLIYAIISLFLAEGDKPYDEDENKY